MKVCLILLAVLAGALAESPTTEMSQLEMDNEMIEKFQHFVEFFKKEYKGVTEFIHRIKTFVHNHKRLAEIQKNDPTAEHSAMSPLMDMTEEEFNARNSLDLSKRIKGVLAANLDTTGTPDSWDWREHGAVNAVKDQKQCGSCWTFGTVANIESVNVVQGKGQLLSLSEQELVDCSAGGMGCQGGWPDNAMADLINKNYGLNLESDYTYTAAQGNCKKESYPYKVYIQKYVDISQDETQIAAALVKYGVLSIAINANTLQMYKGGVTHPRFCNPKKLDHAVNLVGFGTDNGTPYWTIRNSWGSWWGEKGYFRMIRGKGMCGLNTAVSSAIINAGEGEITV